MTNPVGEEDALNVWGSPDRVLAISDAAARRMRSDDLVAEIAVALAAAGEYVGRVDLQPSQRVVDFNWAAHQAGRRLGVRVRVDVQLANADADGRAQVRVTPQRPPD